MNPADLAVWVIVGLLALFTVLVWALHHYSHHHGEDDR